MYILISLLSLVLLGYISYRGYCYYRQRYSIMFSLFNYFLTEFTKKQNFPQSEKATLLNNRILRIPYNYNNEEYVLYLPYNFRLIPKMRETKVYLHFESSNEIIQITQQPGLSYPYSPGSFGGDLFEVIENEQKNKIILKDNHLTF